MYEPKSNYKVVVQLLVACSSRYDPKLILSQNLNLQLPVEIPAGYSICGLNLN